MTKSLIRLSAAALALLLVADVSYAASSKNQKTRKATIFSEIFGGSSRKPAVERKKKKRSLFRQDFFEVQRDRGFAGDDGDVRIINGQDPNSRRRKNQNVIVVDEDPEGDPGFGMGNLTYVADRTVPMGGIKMTAERPADPAAAAIYDALASTDSTLRVVPSIRDAVSSHYAASGFKPLWTASGTLTDRGKAVRDVLAAADAEGLDSAAYLPPALGAFDAAPPASDATAMARLDIELSALATRYAREASGGRFEPERLSRYHDVKPPRVEAAAAMKVLGFSPFAADYLKQLHPALPAYALLKAELASLRSAGQSLPPDPIADGPIVTTGKSDPRIPAIRQRLADQGYPQALEASGDPEKLDADLSIQLRLFQKAAGIKVTGLVGPQTIAALNNPMAERNVARVLNNMERLRWLPRTLAARHVFVNQAAYEVRVMNGGTAEWTSRVIVGKPNTQTVVFNDEMETVVFNPSWGVPPSIIANEYLPKLRRDPGYLDRIGFKVVDAKGKTIRSSAVNWSAYGSKVPFGIQQPPGGKNALGEVKFLFPNSHNIYMHDTPTRNLFAEDVRAFSHGCVRVQNPRDFASVLLGWSREEVDSHIETPGSETVRLKTRIPVYITYFTAWPDETGKIQYFNDIYARDKTMENARAGLVVAQK